MSKQKYDGELVESTILDVLSGIGNAYLTVARLHKEVEKQLTGIDADIVSLRSGMLRGGEQVDIAHVLDTDGTYFYVVRKKGD